MKQFFHACRALIDDVINNSFLAKGYVHFQEPHIFSDDALQIFEYRSQFICNGFVYAFSAESEDQVELVVSLTSQDQDTYLRFRVFYFNDHFDSLIFKSHQSSLTRDTLSRYISEKIVRILL